jgi:heme-degrading monooxygenase HmoA
MIARHWKGVTKSEEAENYIRHLQNETFPNLSRIDGFLSSAILKRAVSEGIEFLIVTKWESLDAIKQFAGEKLYTSVVPEKVQAMMVNYDREVSHYEIVYE